MNKTASLAIFVGGMILLSLGINAYDSTSSDISRFFTGATTDKSLWLLVSGGIVTVLGLVGLFRRQKS
jgi:hypothetical protein